MTFEEWWKTGGASECVLMGSLHDGARSAYIAGSHARDAELAALHGEVEALRADRNAGADHAVALMREREALRGRLDGAEGLLRNWCAAMADGGKDRAALWGDALAFLAGAPPSPGAPVAPTPGETRCLDCGTLEGPMDFVLPRRHWLMVHPDDGGVLCANCILARAHRLPGVQGIVAALTFDGQLDGDKPTPYEILTAVTGGALPDTNRCGRTTGCCRVLDHGGDCLPLAAPVAPTGEPTGEVTPGFAQPGRHGDACDCPQCWNAPPAAPPVPVPTPAPESWTVWDEERFQIYEYAEKTGNLRKHGQTSLAAMRLRRPAAPTPAAVPGGQSAPLVITKINDDDFHPGASRSSPVFGWSMAHGLR